MNVVVSARDVFFLYAARHGDVAALRGLTLEVHSGEAVALLGPSGSGKTTFLRLCSGEMRPSTGTLSVLERSVTASSFEDLRRRDIGIVHQHYHRALPPELTVEEIIELPLHLLGEHSRGSSARTRELLQRAGLADRRRARPPELSGGEQQRVAVCAAIAKRPRLVLADEPTGELDPEASAEVSMLLLELVEEVGATALIVTHDTDLAKLAHRTIHVRDGRLSGEGAGRPVLVVDDQGWLRLPGRLRDEAGVRDRVRAEAVDGRIELYAENAKRSSERVELDTPITVAEKRYETDVALVNVSKHYGATDATPVSRLSWTFQPEGFHAVAGPSGSGKTALLNLVAALESPDAGEVWVGGERIDGFSATQAAEWRQVAIGYLSQHSTLVGFLSARENVELGLLMRGFGEDEVRKRALGTLDALGVSSLAQRKADGLSGGEMRRVALARAVASGPRVLIADEPTAHLDRISGRLVIQIIRRLTREAGTTVIAATHDPDLIAAADSVLALGGATGTLGRRRRDGGEMRPAKPDAERSR